MCGRYVRRSDKQRIAEHFHVHGPSLPDFGESFNVAPQTFQPVIRLNRVSKVHTSRLLGGVESRGDRLWAAGNSAHTSLHFTSAN
jgi:hypothetical protein